MTSSAWILAASVIGAFAWRSLHTHRTVLFSAFAVNHVLIVPLAGALAAIATPSKSCTTLGALIVALSWFVYFGCLGGSLVLFSGHATGTRATDAAREIPASAIGAIALGWWALKLLLFAAHGLQSFRIFQTQPAQETALSYVESAAILLANSLLIGAAVAAVVLLAMRRLPWLALLAVASAMVAGAFVGDIGAGVRRTAVALMVIYFVVRYIHVPVKTLSKELMAAVLLGGALMVYYPYVRFNLLDGETAELLTSGQPAQVLAGTVRLVTPNSESIEGGQTTVLREGVAQLHCRLSESQASAWRTSSGKVVGDSLYIALPAILAPRKEERNPDLRLGEAFNLYPDDEHLDLDLSNSPIIQLQADYGPVGWLLAAALQAVGLIVAGILLTCRAHTLTRIFAFGLVWGCITSTEADLNQVVGALRDTLALAGAVEFISLVTRMIYPPLRPTSRVRSV